MPQALSVGGVDGKARFRHVEFWSESYAEVQQRSSVVADGDVLPVFHGLRSRADHDFDNDGELWQCGGQHHQCRDRNPEEHRDGLHCDQYARRDARNSLCHSSIFDVPEPHAGRRGQLHS